MDLARFILLASGFFAFASILDCVIQLENIFFSVEVEVGNSILERLDL